MRLRASRALLAALACALSAVITTRAASSGPQCDFENAPRIVATGDVHGAFDQYVSILRTAGIIDGRNRWAAGTTHFVQVGDVLDRGAASRKVVDLLRKLEREAASARGRVHFLLGNHEAMRMLGDMRFVSAGEYAAFTTGDSPAVRQQVIDSYPEEQRAELLKNTPLGMIELIRAYGPRGEYGAYLRKLNAIARINGMLFVHGGISPAFAAASCNELNDAIRRELGDDLEKTRNAPPTDNLTTREDGPLWYRGLAQEPETFAPAVDAILAGQHARAMVIAHTVTASGRITPRFDGRIFQIDTGMNPDYVTGGRPSALLIEKGVFTAIYLDKREVLEGPRGSEDR